MYVGHITGSVPQYDGLRQLQLRINATERLLDQLPLYVAAFDADEIVPARGSLLEIIIIIIIDFIQ